MRYDELSRTATRNARDPFFADGLCDACPLAWTCVHSRRGMESVELEGLEGEEAELAAWERAAEQLADEEHAPRGTIVSSGAAAREESVNELDADGYAVNDEKSFLGRRQED